SCGCQRTEIKEASSVQLNFGTDVWYRFKLRVSDLTGEVDNSRWMLGAWKQEVDGSPFLALRFEGGVFYITLESSHSRVMLASSLIDARAFIQVMKGGQGERFGFVTDKELYLGQSKVELEHGKAVYLPDPRYEWVDLTFRVKGGLKGDGVVEIYANQQFVVRATGKIGVDSPSGSKTYFRIGHRRDKAKSNAVLLIDSFRRGLSRDAVTAQ
ncbi:MAG: heparin lyase I family protein, partial [Rhizobiaceae bacterium]